MKRYLIMMVLLVSVGMTGLWPVSVVAVENPVAGVNLEMVHLNQATAEQLQSLPGVGPALAERIVLYRTENGSFKNLDQLTEVKGVGDAKLAKFRNQLIID